MTLLSGLSAIDGIAVGGGNVYCAADDPADLPSGGKILKVPVNGGPPVTLVSRLVALQPAGVALDASSVYWMLGGINGSVLKASVAGGPVTTLASQVRDPRGIATDGTSVYWTTAGGTVMKVPVDGGPPTTLAREQRGPSAIAVDATSVYWTNGNGGDTVVKLMPK